jgi:hypothetical protein
VWVWVWVLLDLLRFCGFVLALVVGFALFFWGLWTCFCVCDFEFVVASGGFGSFC